jgi:SAM-dependent methyltransferase
MPDARANELLLHLARLRPIDRDAAVDAFLGLALPAEQARLQEPPAHDMLGYHPSAIAAALRAFVEAPVVPGDVVVDLGAGLGKVVLLAALLTGARARGIELQPELVGHAKEAALRLGVDAEMIAGDARDAPLDGGTVFYLYVPFTGAVLGEVLARLRAVAARHAIVVCAVGIDLHVPWLVRRDVDSFWLTVYDSVIAGAAPRARDLVSPLPEAAHVIAHERAATTADQPG